MHRTEIAERFLSFLLDPEKAAAIVGDLVETSSLSIATVLRIAGADLLTQFMDEPAMITAMAVRLFLAQFIFFLPVSLVSYLSFVLRQVDWSTVFVAMAATYFLAQMVVGVQLVRMAKSRAVAVCLMLGAMNLAAGFMGLHNVSINMALWQIPIVIGTLCQRWPESRHA